MRLLTIVGCVLLGWMSFATAQEKYDVKAFRIVDKLCSSCHGTPFYFAKQVDEDDWEYFFEPGRLEKIHKNKPVALKNLASKRLAKHRKRVLKFFVDNSKFSGAVHGCDANFCGTRH